MCQKLALITWTHIREFPMQWLPEYRNPLQGTEHADQTQISKVLSEIGSTQSRTWDLSFYAHTANRCATELIEICK